MYKISIGDTYSFACTETNCWIKKKCLIFLSSKILNDKKYQLSIQTVLLEENNCMYVTKINRSPKLHSAMLEVHLQNDDKKPKQKTKQNKTKQTNKKKTKQPKNHTKPKNCK